jgi:hypothetical protein
MGDIRPANIGDPEARAALVWILGQFGPHIQREKAAFYTLGSPFVQRQRYLTAGLQGSHKG